MGKRLAAINHKKREAKKREEAQNGRMNQYYGFGTILALGVIGGLGYYIYRSKKGPVIREVKDVSMPHNPPKPHPQTNKFDMD